MSASVWVIQLLWHSCSLYMLCKQKKTTLRCFRSWQHSTTDSETSAGRGGGCARESTEMDHQKTPVCKPHREGCVRCATQIYCHSGSSRHVWSGALLHFGRQCALKNASDVSRDTWFALARVQFRIQDIQNFNFFFKKTKKQKKRSI